MAIVPRAASILAVVVTGQFLTVASAATVVVALPAIGNDLQVSSTQLPWVIDAYVLVLASLLFVAGVIGDRQGRRQVFVAGLALLAFGSTLGAIALTPMTLLIAPRSGPGPSTRPAQQPRTAELGLCRRSLSKRVPTA